MRLFTKCRSGFAAFLAAGLTCLVPESSRAGDVASFRTDLLPVLTKAGCNAGACHGAATGQGGFKLSLLGYDAEEDFERITREFGGRRIDMARPEESLLLRKASGQLDHEGGRRLRRDSDGYLRLRRWLADGAPFGSRELRVAAVEVEPPELRLSVLAETRPLRVTAVHSDGTRRDVTELALYTANDDGIAEVSKAGEVRSTGRGLTAVMIRYGGQVAAARVRVPWREEASEGSGGQREEHFVDRHVSAELTGMGVTPSPASDEAEFLRRVTLDVAGRLPTVAAAKAFLAATPSREARLRVVEELLGSDEFVDFWTLKLGDLLLLGGKGGAVGTYHAWLREQVATNVPVDRMARALIVATGNAEQVGPAGFQLLASDPRDLGEHVGRMFLGAQLACARCHAHPSDRWTQEDYHRFAAYFARVQRQGAEVSLAARGEVEHPKTGQPLAPRPLGDPGSGATEDGEADRRVALAEWMTAADNPYFARTFVNRVWKHLLGRGLVEPVDDLRPTNPATHPALLDALAGEFVRTRYDLRRLIRTIVASRAYQRSSRSRDGNGSDTQLYSRAYAKELPAAVFADAVAQVLGVADRYEGYPEGTRAVQLRSPATPSAALDVLGRCARKRPCEGGGRSGGGLAQALHLIHGATIHGKLAGGRLEALVGLPDREVVEELYLAALTRRPSAAEREAWEGLLAGAASRREAVEDLAWTILNSREFGMNH